MENESKKILSWAWETFAPNVAALSSFQTQSIPLLHLISRTCPEMKIIFVDTGFHFQETISFRDRVATRLGLNLVVAHSGFCRRTTIKHQLFFNNPDLCCSLNKVDTLSKMIKALKLKALISGIRGNQTELRQHLGKTELWDKELLRIHPMISWTDNDLQRYTERYDLPSHPLTQYGYLSIGCAPCTCPVRPGNKPRSGRWINTDKVECGLHEAEKWHGV